MKIPSPRAVRRARVEIIPLIDIMFFLLATFMMVSLSMIKNKGIPVSLPVASSGTTQDRGDDSAVISIGAGGELAFNKEALGLPEVIERVRDLRSRIPEPKIFINGDSAADFGRVVSVLDGVRVNGITRIAIETKSAAEAESDHAGALPER